MFPLPMKRLKGSIRSKQFYWEHLIIIDWEKGWQGLSLLEVRSLEQSADQLTC